MSEHRFPWANEWPEIHNPRVREAFAKVPREAFVNAEYRPWANRDAPLPIGSGQTISQPFVVALMTQAVDPRPGDKVLEIGTGSGFQTAILCELTRQSGDRADQMDAERVFSVERHAKLADAAVQVLASFGYAPQVRVGDGAAGWPDQAPYDVIIVTAAARCLPAPLWEQLDEGGRMAIPIGRHYSEQTLWRIVKRANELHHESLGPVRFVPLVSALLDNSANCKDL